MDIRDQINELVAGKQLACVHIEEVMNALMAGSINPAQQAAFLTALAIRPLKAGDLAACVRVLRSKARTIKISASPLIDTCGTGGDGKGLFNVSTAAAFVAAAGGVFVAKHGNKSISGNSGSADLMALLGADIKADDASIQGCINEVGVGFLFAPLFHQSMKNVAKVRVELGIKTLFNQLGPMLNPAGVKRQVIGVYDPALLEKVAEVLNLCGSEHVLVVHAHNGCDEITTHCRTDVVELKDKMVSRFCIDPAHFRIQPPNLEGMKAANSKESLEIILQAFSGQHADAARLIAINAACSLVVADKVCDVEQGYKKSLDLIETGAALERLERFKAYCA